MKAFLICLITLAVIFGVSLSLALLSPNRSVAPATTSTTQGG